MPKAHRSMCLGGGWGCTLEGEPQEWGILNGSCPVAEGRNSWGEGPSRSLSTELEAWSRCQDKGQKPCPSPPALDGIFLASILPSLAPFTNLICYSPQTGCPECLSNIKPNMCVYSVASVVSGDPMDCSPPGSSVHGILQARIPDWVALLQGIFQTQGSNLSLLGLLH